MPEAVATKPNTLWYRAITLAERLATGPTTSGQNPPDFEQAAKRLERWRSQASLRDQNLFNQRLALDCLTEASFSSLMCQPAEAFAEGLSETPAWVVGLEEALSQPLAEGEGELPFSATFDPAMSDFLELIRPLIAQARRNLKTGIAEICQHFAQLPFDPATIEDLLLTGLDELLVELIAPTLVLELQVARFSGQLTGDSSEARFQSFIELLRQPEKRTGLLQEYNALARLALTLLQNRVAAGLEFLRHLCEDWPQLVALFSPDVDRDQLIKLETGQGDSHRGGRAVLIAHFSSGLRLAYKPRSMAVDQHFQELLDWLNERGAQPAFRSLKILNGDTHGWMEFVEAAGCQTEGELQRFYERQGAYLALLYALGATDFHYGNLIAAGEHPMLLDLEALFHPSLSAATSLEAGNIADRVIEYSVLRVGLLPQRIWANKDSVGVEMSGLGGEEGQLSPQPLPMWEDVGTDKMRRVRKRVVLPVGKNRPSLNGAKVHPLDYVEYLVRGFSDLYELMLKHRAELLDLIARFEQDPVRVVLRATRLYQLFHDHSLNPDKLRDALELDCLYDKLWLNVKHLPYLSRVIRAERYDLHQGDVPYFTTLPGSTHLWTSTGQVIPDFLAEPTLQEVQNRLTRLDKSDLAKQLWFIRASFSTFAPGIDSQKPLNHQPVQPQKTVTARREDFLNAARAIGDRLEELALRGENDVTWIGLSLERIDHWFLNPLNLTLYDGLPGVALFLAYLGHCTGEERYTQLAKAALPHLRGQINGLRQTLKAPGAYEGWGGVIYALAHLSALWDDPALLEESLTLVDLLPPLIEQDQYLDIITGLAGCISVMLSLYHYHPDEKVLAIARQSGERLVALATPQKTGMAWHTTMPASQAACGFGRGSTGIGYALLQLAAITGEACFKETGLAALEYERSVFSESESNWPDFRTAGKEPLPEGVFRFMTAWCHGAPGIGLARLALLDHYADPILRTEVEAAVKNTLAYPFGLEASLCHGDLGNLDLLLEASRKLNDTALAEQVQQISAAILERAKSQGWICSNPLLVETPGFMVGLAGIGYGLLRLADPERVPSVLILEPPRPTLPD